MSVSGKYARTVILNRLKREINETADAAPRRRRRKLASAGSLRAGQQHARHGESGAHHGCVGSSPIQNIGAYGVEHSASATTLTALNWKRENVWAVAAECRFGYRDGIFKMEHIRIALRSSRWSAFVKAMAAGVDLWRSYSSGQRSPRNRFDAVCHMRTTKLPGSKVNGNARRFLKKSVNAQPISLWNC